MMYDPGNGISSDLTNENATDLGCSTTSRLYNLGFCRLLFELTGDFCGSNSADVLEIISLYVCLSGEINK